MKKFRVLSLLSVLAFIMLFTACGGEKKAAEEKKAEPLEIKGSNRCYKPKIRRTSKICIIP